MRQGSYLSQPKRRHCGLLVFPEPDMAYLEPSSEFIQEVRDNMPELPKNSGRYVNQPGLPEYDAEVLTRAQVWCIFDSCVRLGRSLRQSPTGDGGPSRLYESQGSLMTKFLCHLRIW